MHVLQICLCEHLDEHSRHAHEISVHGGTHVLAEAMRAWLFVDGVVGVVDEVGGCGGGLVGVGSALLWRCEVKVMGRVVGSCCGESCSCR